MKGCTPNIAQRRPKGGKKPAKPMTKPKPKKMNYRPQGR